MRRGPAILTAIAAAVAGAALFVGTRESRTGAPPEQPPSALQPVPADDKALRVCADPNNLPFSNKAGEGLENKLVEMIAADLGKTIRYTWWAQRRGNVRETLNAGRCDLIPGVASSLEMLATTRPYYRSTYVAVTRADRGFDFRSFDDPRLARMKIGVQLIGDDGANTPPAHALTRRGHIRNIKGYTVYGDYSKQAPQREIVDAVARGEVDIAFVWGPVAGYFGKRAGAKLTLAPTPPFDGPQLPMIYDVSMGVRKADTRLRAQLDEALAKRQSDISNLLRAYGVTIVTEGESGTSYPVLP
jgi:mxaJ protein